MKFKITVLLGVMLLSGCASTEKMSEQNLPNVPSVTTTQLSSKDKTTTEKVGRAVVTPLSDLNMVQEKIPAILKEANKEPYIWAGELECSALKKELLVLDEALDLGGTVTEKDKTLLNRGLGFAENQGVSAVQKTMEGFVPFRGWVRKLSGAERHSKEVSGAIQAGTMRRSYIKGIMYGMKCNEQIPINKD